MNKIGSILFVCTGNSCRSVIAEGLMKKYLKEMGKGDIEVRSAGISAIAGFSPTEETIEVMKGEGVDLSDFRSKMVTPEDIKKADLILVMEYLHKEAVMRMSPEAKEKTFLLKEFRAEGEKTYPENLNISDPIGRPMDYYKLSLEIIKEQVKRITELL